MDEDDRRIRAILGKDGRCTTRNASRYRDFLLRHLTLPHIVTGLEDFPWEEPCLFGGWAREEYEQMKKPTPLAKTHLSFRRLSLQHIRGRGGEGKKDIGHEGIPDRAIAALLRE